MHILKEFHLSLCINWDEFHLIVSLPSCDCDRLKDYAESIVRQKLLQFLMGLNNSCVQPRSQILMMNPSLSVNQCYVLIIQDESQ